MISGIPDALRDAKIFPIAPGTKDPATKHGWKDATSDAAQIAEWANANPDFNWGVACGPSELFVFDIDPGGLQWWADLLNDRPDIRAIVDGAFTVRTPKGGLHVYFRGAGPSTASRISQGIDTRGGFMRAGKMVSGGYVVLPGSRTVAGPGRVDGSYEYIGGDLKALPPVLSAIVPERKKTDTLGLEKSPDKDQPRNVQWAIDLLQNYVKAGQVSIEGQGGDNRAFQVAASVLDKAISPGTAYELLQEHWNPHCQPPWDEWELEQKIINAMEHGEDTKEGVKGFQTNADAFSNFAGMMIEQPERKRRGLMMLHDYADNVQDPSWLIPDIVPSNGVGMLFGDSGSYKSFLALDMALCLAYGIPGQWGAPPVKNDVIFFAGEGPVATAKKRWPAWMEQHGIKNRDDHRFFIYDMVPFYTDTEEWTFIQSDIARLKIRPKLIVIDTLARLNTGMDENSSKDMQLVVDFMERIARDYECAVLFIHHTGKDQSKGARGSSALFAGVEFAALTKKTQMGTLLKIKKQKDADVSDDVRYFETKEVAGSIVLALSNDMPQDTAQLKGSRYPWASPEEVHNILQNKLGGSTSTAMLVQEIAGDHGIDPEIVRRQISGNAELKWLNPEKHTWRVPPKMEFDL